MDNASILRCKGIGKAWVEYEEGMDRVSTVLKTCNEESIGCPILKCRPLHVLPANSISLSWVVTDNPANFNFMDKNQKRTMNYFSVPGLFAKAFLGTFE